MTLGRSNCQLNVWGSNIAPWSTLMAAALHCARLHICKFCHGGFTVLPPVTGYLLCMENVGQAACDPEEPTPPAVDSCTRPATYELEPTLLHQRAATAPGYLLAHSAPPEPPGRIFSILANSHLQQDERRSCVAGPAQQAAKVRAQSAWPAAGSPARLQRWQPRSPAPAPRLTPCCTVGRRSASSATAGCSPGGRRARRCPMQC